MQKEGFINQIEEIVITDFIDNMGVYEGEIELFEGLDNIIKESLNNPEGWDSHYKKIAFYSFLFGAATVRDDGFFLFPNEDLKGHIVNLLADIKDIKHLQFIYDYIAYVRAKNQEVQA